jgi:hypothetical protein
MLNPPTLPKPDAAATIRAEPIQNLNPDVLMMDSAEDG